MRFATDPTYQVSRQLREVQGQCCVWIAQPWWVRTAVNYATSDCGTYMVLHGCELKYIVLAMSLEKIIVKLLTCCVLVKLIIVYP